MLTKRFMVVVFCIFAFASVFPGAFGVILQLWGEDYMVSFGESVFTFFIFFVGSLITATVTTTIMVGVVFVFKKLFFEKTSSIEADILVSAISAAISIIVFTSSYYLRMIILRQWVLLIPALGLLVSFGYSCWCSYRSGANDE